MQVTPECWFVRNLTNGDERRGGRRENNDEQDSERPRATVTRDQEVEFTLI